jgi:hypothetical protein
MLGATRASTLATLYLRAWAGRHHGRELVASQGRDREARLAAVHNPIAKRQHGRRPDAATSSRRRSKQASVGLRLDSDRSCPTPRRARLYQRSRDRGVQAAYRAALLSFLLDHHARSRRSEDDRLCSTSRWVRRIIDVCRIPEGRVGRSSNIPISAVAFVVPSRLDSDSSR